MSFKDDGEYDLFDIWEKMFVEENIKTKNEIKQHKGNRIFHLAAYKKHIFIGAYILLLIVELFFCVPYHSIQIFKSAQNVPHTEIIGSGYSTIFDISDSKVYVFNHKDTATGKRVDSGQLVTNVSITTALAVVVYFLFIHKKTSPVEISDKAFNENLNSLKKQNVQLQKTIDTLYAENQQLIKDKNECEKLLLKKIQAEEKLVNSEQLSLEDVLINEPPYLDINELAFADEETVKRMQKQHTEKLYLYIKNRLDKEQR